MSISELVSKFTPAFGAQVGVVLFTAVFAALIIRLWSKSQRDAIQTAAALPLADDDMSGDQS